MGWNHHERIRRFQSLQRKTLTRVFHHQTTTTRCWCGWCFRRFVFLRRRITNNLEIAFVVVFAVVVAYQVLYRKTRERQLHQYDFLLQRTTSITCSWPNLKSLRSLIPLQAVQASPTQPTAREKSIDQNGELEIRFQNENTESETTTNKRGRSLTYSWVFQRSCMAEDVPCNFSGAALWRKHRVPLCWDSNE